MKRFDGVVTGIVKDVQDPSNEGKVKLTFPWLEDEYESNWVPIAVPMSGKERGHWFSPEVDDEVLVAFEHGDFDHPFVVGFLWNGQDKPPYESNDRSIRRIKTVAGHIIEFDDRSGNEKITLKSKAGHYLEIDDPGSKVTLTGQSGNKIVIEDQAGKITATTTSQATLVLDNAGPKATLSVPTASLELGPSGVTLTVSTGTLTVNAASGSATLNCLSATVNASATATVSAAGSLTVSAASMTFNSGIATFTGVVQATTLIASSAVVSPSYTPGAGNLI